MLSSANKRIDTLIMSLSTMHINDTDKEEIIENLLSLKGQIEMYDMYIFYDGEHYYVGKTSNLSFIIEDMKLHDCILIQSAKMPKAIAEAYEELFPYYSFDSFREISERIYYTTEYPITLSKILTTCIEHVK